MSSTMFDIIKRNLAVPDEDRGAVFHKRLGSPHTIRKDLANGFIIAYRLHTVQGMNRYAACRKAAAEAGCSQGSIYNDWLRYETRLKADGLL